METQFSQVQIAADQSVFSPLSSHILIVIPVIQYIFCLALKLKAVLSWKKTTFLHSKGHFEQGGESKAAVSRKLSSSEAVFDTEHTGNISRAQLSILQSGVSAMLRLLLAGSLRDRYYLSCAVLFIIK